MKYKKESRTYFIANNASNRKKDILHSFSCRYNSGDEGYKGMLRKKGIIIDDEDVISCTLKEAAPQKKKKDELPSIEERRVISLSTRTNTGSQGTKGQASLRILFSTLLQEMNINRFNPGELRNIGGRLYKAGTRTKINGKWIKDSLFLARTHAKVDGVLKKTASVRKYDFRKHQLVIGWGSNRNSEYVPYYKEGSKNIMTIPLLSLDDKSFVCNLTVFESIFKNATTTRVDTDFGYWVLWRDFDGKTGKLVDKELIFVPAEEQSMIPVESSYEEQMIAHLLLTDRKFEKPLVGNLTQYFLDARPDMMLLDTTPYTVVEVAGMRNEDYHYRLDEKEKHYVEQGYRYVEWDGEASLLSHTALNQISKGVIW